jgi:hypothetical protein
MSATDNISAVKMSSIYCGEEIYVGAKVNIRPIYKIKVEDGSACRRLREKSRVRIGNA